MLNSIRVEERLALTLRCHFWLYLCVLMLMFITSQCYDPCPENARQSGKSNSLKIPDAEIENAFKQANERIKKRKVLEKKLVGEGRTVNKKIKSAESTHPQASAKPVIRQMEDRQLPFQEASEILAKKYNLSPEQVSCGLPKQQLRQSAAISAVQTCTSDDTIECTRSSPYRTQDGTCNNLNNPTWGSALSCFQRIFPPIYTDNNDGFRTSMNGGGPLPAPRTLSLNVHSNSNRPTNYVNHMYMFFGQLLDHDITFTPQSLTDNNEAIECCPSSLNDHPQCAEINITANDPFYSRFGVTCLNFVRSALCPYCTTGPRSQINSVSTFIDASFVYGNSVNETDGLRTMDGTGTLGIQESAVGDLLLPSNDPTNDQCSLPAQNQICFRSGDQRANQHPTLTSLHTLFHREHNRIARILRQVNPQWNDENLFQESRKIVGAEMQVITYNEYLPITLGEERMTYFDLWISRNPTCHNQTLDPTLFTEFSTAAFRFGHSLINSLVAESPSRQGHSGHLLRDTFFYPFDIYTGEMDPLLRGATRSPSQYFDRYMVPDVTNFLYRIRGNSTGLDLASFNIQRGRDHGLQGYTEYVRFCSKGVIIVRYFEDLVRYALMTSDNANILSQYYNDVRDIDLFTGCITEIYNDGAVIGPTATCIIGLQYQRLKFGDRFYFQHEKQPGSFTRAQMEELKKTSLAKIMCDNSGITQMQRKAMLFTSRWNPIVSCSQIQGMNLELWRA